MAIRLPLHWHEGMFLHPHHFQFFQRSIDAALVSERDLARSFSYGLIEFRLAPGALENKQVRIDRLRVVLRSGLEICVPENAELHTLDIKSAFDNADEPLTIALAVPSYTSERPNELDPARPLEKRRYRAHSANARDENTGDNQQAVPVRRFNAQLIVAPDGPVSDLDVIPLFRVARGIGERIDQPVLDEIYIPATIWAAAWPPLRSRVEGVAARAEATRAQLVNRMVGGGFNAERMQGAQIEQLIRLQTLARYGARLSTLVSSPAARPFEYYLELRSFVAELLSLSPSTTGVDLPDYDHDNLTLSFGHLFARLDSLLAANVTTRYRTADFADVNRVKLATLNDDDIRLPNEYFLAIESPMNPQEIATLVQNRVRFKVMSERKVNDAVYGVEVREERAPLGLPTPANVYYFRLLFTGDDHSKNMWKAITTEKKLAIRWPNIETTDFRKLTLYMMVPEGRTGGTP